MKRFYREVKAVETNLGWQVELDGRPVRTQGGNAQVVLTGRQGRMLADEWAAQGETIDPALFRHRDLADFAIDVVAVNRDAAITDMLRYAETDTLCYRADPDEPLWKRQQEIWEPLLTECEARETVRFQRVSGVIHRPQDNQTLESLRRRLETFDEITLAALTTLTSLAASLVIGLAALEPGADREALWDAANLEEDWQVDLWGRDPEAAAHREKRKAAFVAAIDFVRE